MNFLLKDINKMQENISVIKLKSRQIQTTFKIM